MYVHHNTPLVLVVVCWYHTWNRGNICLCPEKSKVKQNKQRLGTGARRANSRTKS